MKKIILLTIISFVFLSCKQENKPAYNEKKSNTEIAEFAIVIHGGAGTILKKNMTPEKEAAYKAKLEEAIRVGYIILENNGSGLDAVETTIPAATNDAPLTTPADSTSN